MLGSASTEFIALCQSQVLLLTRTLEASSTVVYLAEPSNDLASPTLVPLVAYPDNADVWTDLQAVLTSLEGALPVSSPGQAKVTSLLSSSFAKAEPGLLFSSAQGFDRSELESGDGTAETVESQPGEAKFPWPDALPTTAAAPSPAGEVPSAGPSAQPMVLPLAHEGVVLGVIVSTREAPAWNREDYHQAEQVAKTLAIACVMDQRDQWWQTQLRQRQLQQADQSQIFHDLLHQFRNPLTALQTFGKLLLKRMQPDDPNQSIAEGILRETKRLQDLAENFDEAVAEGDRGLEQAETVPLERWLLPAADSADTPAKVWPGVDGETAMVGTPGGKLPMTANQGHGFHGLGRDLSLQPGTVSAVIEPLLLSAAAIAQDRERTIVQDIPADLPEVWLNVGALREVLSNLLDNALKYAPRGALIWVSGGLVQHLNGNLYQGIAIGDTGPGIPPQDQEHIFERHYRGVQTESQTPGTGLGLAIVQELVTAMGGHIDLISPVQLDHWLPPEATPRVSGPGSLFIVWLKTV